GSLPWIRAKVRATAGSRAGGSRAHIGLPLVAASSKEADVTGRALSVVVALMLAPGIARSDPGSPEPQSQQSETPPAGAAAPKVPPELANRADFTLTLTTLDALHKKGMMTDEEYNAALRDLISVGMKAATSPTFVLGRFVTTFYGYLEGDVIHDSQRVVTDGY